MNILIVEDDPQVQAFLKEGLEPEFSPVSTMNRMPNELDYELDKNPPSAIILDRLLGEVDSKNYLSYLRKKFPNTFIIVLSAINNSSERSEVLDLGADDYMGKPFSLVELKSRIRAVTRRVTKVEQLTYIQLEGTILDLNYRTLSVGEKVTSLSAKEFELFYLFAKKVGRVYSKFELMDKVWKSNLEIESNVLEVTVMNLRKKLEEIQSAVKINSKRNIGYWVEA